MYLNSKIFSFVANSLLADVDPTAWRMYQLFLQIMYQRSHWLNVTPSLLCLGFREGSEGARPITESPGMCTHGHMPCPALSSLERR